jgi:hypothetical protein
VTFNPTNILFSKIIGLTNSFSYNSLYFSIRFNVKNTQSIIVTIKPRIEDKDINLTYSCNSNQKTNKQFPDLYQYFF